MALKPAIRPRARKAVRQLAAAGYKRDGSIARLTRVTTGPVPAVAPRARRRQAPPTPPARRRRHHHGHHHSPPRLALRARPRSAHDTRRCCRDATPSSSIAAAQTGTPRSPGPYSTACTGPASRLHAERYGCESARRGTESGASSKTLTGDARQLAADRLRHAHQELQQRLEDAGVRISHKLCIYSHVRRHPVRRHLSGFARKQFRKQSSYCAAKPICASAEQRFGVSEATARENARSHIHRTVITKAHSGTTG